MSNIDGKVSIIVVAYDTTNRDRQMTGSCIGTIEMYTDREDYELIFVDQVPFQKLGEVSNPGVLKYTPEDVAVGVWRYKPVVVDKYIETTENIGLSAAFNLGAKEATGKYICFMHHDVFVPDNWLPKMVSALSQNRIIVPHQGPTKREDVIRWSKMTHDELMLENGYYDAGMLLMTREDFLKTPGWDEDFKIVFPGRVFVHFICDSLGIGLYCTPEVNIIHFGARTVDPKLNEIEGALLHTKGYIK